MPETWRDILISHYDGVFVGPNGDHASVLEALAGISAAQALWIPAPGRNSIWQIVDHLIASKQWLIEMLRTGQAAPPVWTEPSGDEQAWQATLEELKAAHARVRGAIEHLSDEQLFARPNPEWQDNLLEAILSAGAAHEAHHSGQIDYLKGLYHNPFNRSA